MANRPRKFPISKERRAEELERLIRFAERTHAEENEDSGYFSLNFPCCSIRISETNHESMRFYLKARPFFMPTYMIKRPTDIQQGLCFTGLRPVYCGTEEGLCEVLMEGIQEVRGGLSSQPDERSLREDPKLFYPDKEIYDFLILHASECARYS